jgi:transposase
MYSTDLTETQWKIIKKCLNEKERKRKYCLKTILNAILYIVKTGCQWRMLPKDFPNWEIVYYYFRKWIANERFDIILDELRTKARLKLNQNGKPSLAIVDSQTVRWGNNRALNGYDGNKKIKGIKRHVAVDKNGFLICVMVTIASFHDSTSIIQLLKVMKDAYHNVKTIIADGGYRGGVIKDIWNNFKISLQIVMRNKEEKDKANFKPIHKRWVVERTFAWYENKRRLTRNYELLMETSEEMVKIAAIQLLLNKI